MKRGLIFWLLIITLIIFPSLASCTKRPTPTTVTTPNLTQVSPPISTSTSTPTTLLTTTQTPTNTSTPTPTLAPTLAPTPTPSKTIIITDPANDLFDKDGKPTQGEPYLDIVEAEVYKEDSEYVLTMKMNGPLPEKTPDPQLFYEWDMYVDSDNNSSTGGFWPLVANDLGFEYLVRLMLLDSNYWAQIYDIKTNKSIDIKYTITNDTIVLHSPQTNNQINTFNFVVTAKEYGERGAGSAFILGDKAPNSFHVNFLGGIILDTDNDGFSDDEEVSILGTNPQVAEKWDDLDTVTGILNTPKKVSLFLDRKFNSVSRPSQLFAVPITQLFKEMYGDCDEFARLAMYFLAQNGYKAYLLDIYFNKWWPEYNTWLEHDICVYQDKGDGLWYDIDIYFYGTGINPVGPFKSIEEVCNQLPAHYGATDWTNYKLYDSNASLVQAQGK